MKRVRIVLFVAACALLLTSCGPSGPKSLEDISAQLTRQFRSQHQAKEPGSSRELKSVTVTGFSTPPGNPRPYLGVAITWDKVVTETGLPMIQLGDGLFAVTYQDDTTHEALSAIISFR